jgi:AMP-binding enzyme
MAKVGGAVSSWYWPEGIPRRVPVHQQPVDSRLQVRTAMKAVRDQPAFVSAASTLTYSGLREEMLQRSRAIHSIEPGAGAVAIAERDLRHALPLMLAALSAGKQILLADPDADPAKLLAQLHQCGATMVLTGGSSARKQIPASRVVTVDELHDGPDFKVASRGANQPAVILPSGGDLIVHSHFSITAMAASLTAFIPSLRQLPFLSLHGLSRWEDLTAILGTLLYGTYVIPGSLTDNARPDQTEAYTILTRDDAERLIKIGRSPAVLSRLRYVFVSMAHFDDRWRRHLERILGKPILPIWGMPQAGPAVAAHPSWVPLHSHGIPLVNVNLMPADPASGQLSDVPWEMLAMAEVLVETVSQMLRMTNPQADANARSGKLLRSHALATVDPVGVVTFLE